MALTTDKITELAPDQASLKAASKLTKRAKWPVLVQGDNLVWGECQGSGANPYRTVFDQGDFGYKCTCPSRKFPCKHVLALMWIYVEDPSPFVDGDVPQWVTDWLGRRRTGGTAAKGTTEGKDISAARVPDAPKKVDPKAAARNKAAAEKRAQATQAALEGGIRDLDQWLEDQLRGGLAGFLSDATDRCRTIAARLVDAKAQALAGRLDELPATLMSHDGEARLDVLIQEFGRLVLLGRAWMAQPDDPELRRMIATSETREAVLEHPDATRLTSQWEVVGERVTTRRDGLVSQSTWLMNLGNGHRFAQLLDFFPASLGKRANPFAVGDRFEAELVYYPAQTPMRAVLGDRSATTVTQDNWPLATQAPLAQYTAMLERAPWLSAAPLLLPAGRVAEGGGRLWWQDRDNSLQLPLTAAPPDHVAGLDLSAAIGLWDGVSLSLLSARSEWGRVSFDE